MKSYAETGGQDGAIFDYVSAHNYAKKELGQCPAILTEQLMNNPYCIIFALYKIKIIPIYKAKKVDKK